MFLNVKNIKVNKILNFSHPVRCTSSASQNFIKIYNWREHERGKKTEN